MSSDVPVTPEDDDLPIDIEEIRPAARRYTMAEVADALRQAAGVKTLAARRLGCDRRTVARYIARSEKLRRVVTEIEEESKDLSEATLAAALLAERKLAEAAAREGVAVSIPNTLFVLRTKGRDRGYTTSQELTGPGGGPIQTDHTPDLSKLTDDELREYRELMLRAR